MVAAHLRMQSIRLAVYLDDWLTLNAIRRLLLQDRQKILNLLSQLGFLINAEKSEFKIQTQDITYTGGRFLLAKGIVLPTVDRVSKTKGNNLGDKKTIMHSKTAFTDARPYGFLHRGSTICKTSYEANAVASTVLVETSIRRSRNADSEITTSSRSPQLVVSGSKHAQGQIFSTKNYKQTHKHRYFVARLGQKSRASDCPRSLASREKCLAHKLSRVGSCSFDNRKVSTG